MIDIIVLNFNNLEFTKMCIASLYKNTTYPFKLIVVDNASTEPGTKEYFRTLEKEHNNVIVHFNEVPDSGFAEGNNIGLQYADSEFICLLNNDIVIPKRKKWLETLLEHFKDEKVGLVGCKLLYPNDTIQFAGGHLCKDAFTTPKCFYHRGRFQDKELYSKVEEVPQLTFAFVISRKEVFGKLDEEYKIGTFEDNDKCMELLTKGYKIIYDGRIFLYHYETATQFKRNPQEWNNVQVANQMRFRNRWLPTIWLMLIENPTFWGWTNDDLNQEIERMKRNGVLYNAVLSFQEWLNLTNYVRRAMKCSL